MARSTIFWAVWLMQRLCFSEVRRYRIVRSLSIHTFSLWIIKSYIYIYIWIAWWTLSLPQTSRANPVQYYKTCNVSVNHFPDVASFSTAASNASLASSFFWFSLQSFLGIWFNLSRCFPPCCFDVVFYLDAVTEFASATSLSFFVSLFLCCETCGRWDVLQLVRPRLFLVPAIHLCMYVYKYAKIHLPTIHLYVCI